MKRGEQIHDNILRFYCIRYLRQFSIILSRTPIRFAVRKYFSPTNGALSPSRNTVLSLIFALSIHRAGPCVSHNGEGAGKGRADTRLSSLKHGSARVNGGTWKSSLYQAYNRADWRRSGTDNPIKSYAAPCASRFPLQRKRVARRWYTQPSGHTFPAV